jgi:hypothetical protein
LSATRTPGVSRHLTKIIEVVLELLMNIFHDSPSS